MILVMFLWECCTEEKAVQYFSLCVCLLGGVLGEKAPYQILGLNLFLMHAKSFEYISFSIFLT